jgi:protein phosphatase 1G
MSFDHKPEDEPERNRIEKAGGFVSKDGRVNDGLNLSRAIGDHTYKKNKSLTLSEQMITSLPDVLKHEIDIKRDTFMVLACDGIWNFMSSQEVCDYISERLSANYKNLSQICEELFMHCLAPDSDGDGTGCDNMTCVIVTFNPFKSSVYQINNKNEISTNGTKRSHPIDDENKLGEEQNSLKKMKQDQNESTTTI